VENGKAARAWRALESASVTAGEVSDPYLMTGYDHKTVELSHDAKDVVHIILEVDVAADGNWQTFRVIDVPAGHAVKYEFPAGYSAHWIRAKTDTACHATVQFNYD
jgi:hypothetical protein